MTQVPPGADMRSVAGLDPGLVAQMRGLLNRARVISEVAASQLAPIGHSQPGSRLLARDHLSTLEQITGRLHAVATDAELAEAITWAQKLIDHATRGPEPVALESTAERNQRICLEHQGLPAGVVATRELLSKSLVRKLRAEGFIDARTHRRRRFSSGEGREILGAT